MKKELTPAQLKHLRAFCFADNIPFSDALLEFVDIDALDRRITFASKTFAGKSERLDFTTNAEGFARFSSFNETPTKEHKELTSKYLHNRYLLVKRANDTIETPLLFELQKQNPNNIITSLEANNSQCTIDYFDAIAPFDFRVGDIVYIGSDRLHIESVGSSHQIYSANELFIDFVGLIPFVSLWSCGWKATAKLSSQTVEYLGKEKQTVVSWDNEGRRANGTFKYLININSYKLKQS